MRAFQGRREETWTSLGTNVKPPIVFNWNDQNVIFNTYRVFPEKTSSMRNKLDYEKFSLPSATKKNTAARVTHEEGDTRREEHQSYFLVSRSSQMSIFPRTRVFSPPWLALLSIRIITSREYPWSKSKFPLLVFSSRKNSYNPPQHYRTSFKSECSLILEIKRPHLLLFLAFKTVISAYLQTRL